MSKALMILTLTIAVALSVASARAHDEYRVIGTVVKFSQEKSGVGNLDVKQTKDGKLISMWTNPYTVVTRDKKKVGFGELKAGRNVVVDGIGDSIDDLLVIEVRIVPAPTR